MREIEARTLQMERMVNETTNELFMVTILNQAPKRIGWIVKW